MNKKDLNNKTKKTKSAGFLNKTLDSITKTLYQGITLVANSGLFNPEKEKDFRRNVRSAAIKTLLLGMVGITIPATLSAVNVGREIENQSYKTDEQIYQDGEALGTDVAVATFQNFFSEFTRVKHNDGEPIYVYVPDSYNSREKEMIESVYSYYNGIFETINPNYHFKFVDKSTMLSKSLQGKTVVNFNKLNMPNAAGGGIKIPAISNPNFTAKIEIIMDKEIPEEDPDFSKMTEEETKAHYEKLALYYDILFEEISHGMGFGDVYYKNNSRNFFEIGLAPTTNNIYYNTIMSNFYDRNILDLYPEDYRTLHALYNENLRNEDGSMNMVELAKVKEMVDTYENLFYANRKDGIKHKISEYILSSGTTEQYDIKEEELEGLVINETGRQYFIFNTDREQQKDLGVQWYDFKYIFNDGKVTFEIYEYKTENLLERTTTDYKFIDGVIYIDKLILKDVPLILGWSTQFQTEGVTVNSIAIGKELKTYDPEWEAEPRADFKVYLLTDLGGEFTYDLDRQNNMFAEYREALGKVSAKYSIPNSPEIQVKNQQTIKEKQAELAKSYPSKFDVKTILDFDKLIINKPSNPIFAWRKEDDTLGIFENYQI